MQTRGVLNQEEKSTKNFCSHILQAREAHNSQNYAKVESINLQDVLSKVSDESLEEAFINESTDNEISVYVLPGGNIAVSLLGTEKNQFVTDFVDIRDLKCTLDICSKKVKSKVHTLVVKGVPVCRHSLLG